MTRTARCLALVGLAVLLLAGCGSAGARGGAAAVVGSTRISESDLQAVTDRGLSDPQAKQQYGADPATFQLGVLNRLVRSTLLERTDADQGVSVSQGDVDALLADYAQRAGGRTQLEQQAAAGGVAKQDLPAFARLLTLEQALGDKLTADLPVPEAQLQQLYDQNVGQFQQARSRHILVADEAQARSLLAQVQSDPSRFAALAAQYSTDTSNKDKGGELGFQGKGTFVPEFDAVVFSAPVGSFSVVHSQFGWHVVQVEERRTTTLQQATPLLRRSVLATPIKDRVTTALRDTAAREHVSVNPRFGRWDAKAAEIAPVPADDGMSSPAPGGTPAPATGVPSAAPGTGEQPAPSATP